VAVLAGTSSLGWKKAMLGALVGSLPAAAIYALTGAAVADFGSGALVFCAAVAVGACVWLVERRLTGKANGSQRRPLTTSVSA
jgi:uncharacterized membrane protein YdjX (TVP38/TMEM64 family)